MPLQLWPDESSSRRPEVDSNESSLPPLNRRREYRFKVEAVSQATGFFALLVVWMPLRGLCKLQSNEQEEGLGVDNRQAGRVA